MLVWGGGGSKEIVQCMDEFIGKLALLHVKHWDISG